jgi:predicted RNase H-like nuclease (RuvC/YqgF family)
MSDDEYGEDSFDDTRGTSPAKPSSRGPPPQSMRPAKELTEDEISELEELTRENDALQARIKEYEARDNVIDELEHKLENMKAQVKAANLNAGAIKERDKLR